MVREYVSIWLGNLQTFYTQGEPDRPFARWRHFTGLLRPESFRVLHAFLLRLLLFKPHEMNSVLVVKIRPRAISWSFSRGDRERALFLQLPHRLITSSNTRGLFRLSFGIEIRPMSPRNNFAFVPNWLPNLFARRPEMTRPLPAKIGPIEEGVGHATPSDKPSAILSFPFHWVRQATQ